jgi:cytochrome c oxidase cbb3-type subunit III
MTEVQRKNAGAQAKAEADRAIRRTTGHEWDGITEFNTPTPTWWLYVFYATILFSVVYWVLYPAWPFVNSYTRGILGYNSHALLERQMADLATARKAWTDRIAKAPLDQIARDGELLQYAEQGGAALFAQNCASCHGANGQGARGFPNLADDSWLWGGTLDAIHVTLEHGIRSGDPNARDSQMPRFGADQILKADQIDDVAEFVLGLSGQQADPAAAARGKVVFADNCAACHGDQGQGMVELGAPALNDAIWLYGGTKADIVAQVANPHQGVMPAWSQRLDDVSLKLLAVYVHSLGGGQ